MTQNKEKKTTVSYNFDEKNQEMTYTVKKDDKEQYSLSIDDKGYVTIKEKDNILAELHVNLDQELRNVGGNTQYTYVDKPIKVNSLEGLLDVYEKINNQEFTSYNKNGNDILYGDEKKRVGDLMLSFVDTYVLNTPESREVLNEYLNRETPKQRKETQKSNEAYIANLNNKGR